MKKLVTVAIFALLATRLFAQGGYRQFPERRFFTDLFFHQPQYATSNFSAAGYTESLLRRTRCSGRRLILEHVTVFDDYRRDPRCD